MAIRLGLDLAGHSGYAIRYEDGSYKTAVWNLVRGNLGGRRSPVPMLRLWRRLNYLSENYEIEKVTLEEAFGRGDAKYRLDSLQHIAILWAVLNGITWQRVSPGAWKKVFIGKGTASKLEYSTAAIEYWPNIRMWSDDQCAAMWLLAYGRR